MGKFFDGAGGGLVSGAMALAGGALDALYQKNQQKRQMEHDKNMASLNQENILAQMSTQNQYQVEQWERENAYNDPSAVAQRYREAGINPRSAFGNSSASGAGIAGGLSSAPSGSSTASASNIMGDASFAGIGSAYLQGARLQAQNRKDIADAKLKEEKAESEYYERTFIKPHTARLTSALADKGMSDAELSKVEAQWAPYMKELESRLKEANLNSIIQGIEESKQRTMTSKAILELKEEERALVKEQIAESAQRTLNYAYERAYKSALTNLTKNKARVAQMEYSLKEAQKGHIEKLKSYVEKEIEYLGKQMALTDAQITKWKNDTALGWSKFGASVAQATSQEIRNWMFGFIPGVDQKSTNFMDFDVPMFAD